MSCKNLNPLPVLQLLLLLSIALSATDLSAHRDDYLDETFVYMTLKQGEFELEGWIEARIDSTNRLEGWYTAGFEWGLLDRWTVDGAAQFIQLGKPAFGRLRFETRFRFGEENRWPVDVAASCEYEYESAAAAGGTAESTLTPRLILSHDLSAQINTTLNLDFPVPLERDSQVSWAFAIGARYGTESFLRAGIELKGNPAARELTVFPQLWFALPHESTVKIGTGIGLTRRTDKLIARLVAELEF